MSNANPGSAPISALAYNNRRTPDSLRSSGLQEFGRVARMSAAESGLREFVLDTHFDTEQRA